jgi:threonine synthase
MVFFKSTYSIEKNNFKDVVFADIPSSALREIIKNAFSFPIEIKKLTNNLFVLKLDLGPTFSFKDFGVRFLAYVMEYFLKKEKKKILVLTATSGDTGSAVAAAFAGLTHINAVILFPKNGVTDFQRRQMTTQQENIRALAVEGNFDDCQAMVKQAFLDEDLKKLNLISANSINIIRLLAQIPYYFFAKIKVDNENKKDLVFVVPSGNFGNFTAGIYAQLMGLSAFKMIAAVNKNDEFFRFIKSGDYQPLPHSFKTLANAMDIANPSNLIRIFYHFGGKLEKDGRVTRPLDFPRLKKFVDGERVFDGKIKETIKFFYEKFNYLTDPHTAVALKVFRDFSVKKQYLDKRFIIVETAHPIKFQNVYHEAFKKDKKFNLETKLSLKKKKERIFFLSAKYEKLKEFLLSYF